MASLCFVTKTKGTLAVLGKATVTLSVPNPALPGGTSKITNTIDIFQIIPVDFTNGSCKDCALIGRYTTRIKLLRIPVKFGPIALGFRIPGFARGLKIEDVSVDVNVDVKLDVTVESYCCGRKIRDPGTKDFLASQIEENEVEITKAKSTSKQSRKRPRRQSRAKKGEPPYR